MVPSLEAYSRKYANAVHVALLVPCALLSMSLARNTLDITLVELVWGLGAIAAVIAFSLVLDERGYWFYAVASGKIIDKSNQASQAALALLPPGNWRVKCLTQPLHAALLAWVMAGALAALAYPFLQGHHKLLILACGFVIFPLALGQLSGRGTKYHLRDMLAPRPTLASARRPWRIGHAVALDLALALTVNLPLVLPIARKPAFDLSDGYDNIAFVIAFVILLWVVFAFMGVFALKPRRLVLVGELLRGDIDSGYAGSAPWASRLGSQRWLRYAAYFLLLAGWAILLCIAFAHWVVAPHFILLYGVGLLPIAWIYAIERYQVLFSNFRQAQDMVRRMPACGLPIVPSERLSLGG